MYYFKVDGHMLKHSVTDMVTMQSFLPGPPKPPGLPEGPDAPVAPGDPGGP